MNGGLVCRELCLGRSSGLGQGGAREAGEGVNFGVSLFVLGLGLMVFAIKGSAIVCG